MNNNLLFLPIFKTKEKAEHLAFNSLADLIASRPNVIPYFEIIGNRKEKLLLSTANKVPFFAEIIADKYTSVKDLYNLSNSIISFRHKKGKSVKDLIEKVSDAKKQNKRVAIRIDNGLEQELEIITGVLSDSDFLIIDIADTKYSASLFYISKIKSTNPKYKIIVFSRERNNDAGGSFAKFDYNEDEKFNNSIIKAIKNNTFTEDGFGSFCTAKDVFDDGHPTAEVFAVFLIYDYKKNSFFSIRSEDKAHITVIYNKIADKIKEKEEYLYTNFFNSTLISKRLIKDFIINKVGSGNFQCVTFIGISIVHYIEEVINNL